jgi:putative ABC transport system substrate-binding protein
MQRREFVILLGAAAAWPIVANAQQLTSTTRRVGILIPESIAEARGLLDAFRQGLKDMGWADGQNIAFEYRSADGKEDRLPKIAAELVQLRLDAILAESTPAIRAAKDATQTIPIVMAVSNDPVASSLIASLNRPGGNVTGLSLQSSELAGKRLQLLAEIVPRLARLAVLSNPTNPSHALAVQQMQLRRDRLALGLMS